MAVQTATMQTPAASSAPASPLTVTALASLSLAWTRSCLRGESKQLLALLVALSLAIKAQAGHRRRALLC
jgi:hypothetical protein